MRTFLAVLALVCGMHAAAAQTCVPAGAMMAMVRSHPAYASHHVASAEEAGTASDIFNAVPPESEGRWSAAVLVSLTDGGGVLLVGNGTEICGSLRVAPERWPALLRAVRGSGA